MRRGARDLTHAASLDEPPRQAIADGFLSSHNQAPERHHTANRSGSEFALGLPLSAAGGGS